MLQNGGIGLFDSNGKFNFYCTKVYTDSWKYAIPYIYNGTAWKEIGGAGCLVVPFTDSGGTTH